MAPQGAMRRPYHTTNNRFSRAGIGGAAPKPRPGRRAACREAARGLFVARPGPRFRAAHVGGRRPLFPGRAANGVRARSHLRRGAPGGRRPRGPSVVQAASVVVRAGIRPNRPPRNGERRHFSKKTPISIGFRRSRHNLWQFARPRGQAEPGPTLLPRGTWHPPQQRGGDCCSCCSCCSCRARMAFCCVRVGSSPHVYRGAPRGRPGPGVLRPRLRPRAAMAGRAAGWWCSSARGTSVW
jgi:hypothetical protein